MKKSLNILIFVQDFLPLTQSFIYNEIKGLSYNNNVLVLCMNQTEEQFYPYENVRPLRYRELPIRRKINSFLYKLGIAYLLRKPGLKSELSDIIESFSPDIIHCHFGHQSLPIVSNIERRNIPVFISFHGIDASLYIRKSRLYRQKIAEELSKPSIFAIFDAAFLIKNISQNGMDTQRSWVHFLGIDVDKFARHSFPDREIFTFVQIGAFRSKKGHIYTIRAFKNLKEKKSNIRLIFVGSGPEEDKIKQFVRENQLADFVSFLGDVKQEQVPEILSNAHAFVHPSITDKEGNTEGLPVSIKEAMAMQLPIVSTYHSGIPELVKDGIHGFLCPEKDIVGLSEAMEKVMDMSYLKINAEAIFEEHNIDITTQRLLDYYDTAIAQLKENN